MKALKFFLSCLVCAALAFGCFGVYCSAEQFVAGDIDGDGKVTASEARTILRCATLLETLSDKQLLRADVDGVGGITAADARLALRTATKLETLKVNYDNPEDVQWLIDEINSMRSGRSLAPYAYSGEASAAAYTAAREYEQTAPSYFRPNGANWETVLPEHGVSVSFCAKSIYIGDYDCGGVIESLENDNIANNHIFNRNFKNIGVGVYEAQNGDVYWCFIFYV
ncbi:MAG: hypothetical protein GX851_08775 [Clostridiales bacterium]|nr:hypothetical protein [Clostridiales bacterium]